jgi:hypothetical protein
VKPLVEQTSRNSNDNNPMELFGVNLTKEWMKFQRLFNQCNGRFIHPSQATFEKSYHKNALVDVTMSSSSLVSLSGLKTSLSHILIPNIETTSTLHTTTTTTTIPLQPDNDIPAYLATAQPFLDGLDSLIMEMNMKDPSRC